MMAALTDNEFAEFIELEQTIEAGLQVYYKVGAALLTIREKRLYRADYTNFEAYCIDRWGMGRSYANKLIAASEVIVYLGTTVPIPANEAQARPLTTLEPEHVADVWKVIKDTAPKGVVTSAHVKSVTNVFKEALNTGAIDDGTGASIPIKGALYVAVNEETFERSQRQVEHIKEANTDRLFSPKPVIAEAWFNGENMQFLEADDLPDFEVGKRYRLVIYEVSE